MERCIEKCMHVEVVSEVLNTLPDDRAVEKMTDVFKALSDPGRLKIVAALLSHELCVCDIAAVCELTDSAASHQLRILRNLKIVRNRRQGKSVYYRLSDVHVESLIRQSLEHAGC